MAYETVIYYCFMGGCLVLAAILFMIDDDKK